MFQCRFFSSPMDEKHSIVCARYIERNPVRANIVKSAIDWQWSSAAIHCGKEKQDFLGVSRLFNYIEMNLTQWRRYISEKDDVRQMEEIKKQTRKGRLMVLIEAMRKMEKRLKRKVGPKTRGRPKNRNK